MDTRIAPGGTRTDVTATDTAPRVTPRSAIPFRDVVTRGAGAILDGAQAAISSLPGAPIVAAAVRPVSGPAARIVPPGSAVAPAVASSSPSSVGTAENPLGKIGISAGRAGGQHGRADACAEPGVQSLLPPASGAAIGGEPRIQRHVQRAQGPPRHNQERDRQHPLKAVAYFAPMCVRKSRGALPASEAFHGHRRDR